MTDDTASSPTHRAAASLRTSLPLCIYPNLPFLAVAEKPKKALKMQLQAAEVTTKAQFRFLEARALVGFTDPEHISRAQAAIASLKSDPRELGGLKGLLSPGAGVPWRAGAM